jgi:general secretion pathway protein G
MKNKKGFTLIELLVVIAIIGLLSTLAVVALNNARVKSRDARRVSDIKQVQTALELYMNDVGEYPQTVPAAAECNGTAVIGEPSGCCLSSGSGIADSCSGTTYMAQIPADPLDSQDYVYDSTSSATYTLTYTLEGETAGIAAGAHKASPAGLVDD